MSATISGHRRTKIASFETAPEGTAPPQDEWDLVAASSTAHPEEAASPQRPSRRVPAAVDLAAIRQRLASATGRHFWRSLEELAGTDEFRAYLQAEFPREASVFEALGRREFLRLMGASLALAGLSACTRQPDEKVVPYVRAPEPFVAGEPLFFATAMPLAGVASGVLVESHMGRPTKVEGNPDHPASLGATDVYAQASVLDLYDPDRSQVIRNVGEIRPWSAFLDAARLALEAQHESRGTGLRILTETVTSPTLAQQLHDLLANFPQAKWHQYEPLARDQARAGAVLAFDEPVHTQYHLDKADVIVALDADFLACGPGQVRYVRDFSRRRRVHDPHDTMNRLYVVESTPSVTGAKADHRLPLRSSDVERFARALAARLGVLPTAQHPADTPAIAQWIDALGKDLEQHRGTSVVIAGDAQPAVVHALAHAMNQALGNVGQTVTHTEPIDAQPVDHGQSLRELVTDMNAGAVVMLVILGGNPVFTAPADLGFADALQKVGLRIHVSPYDDETSVLCHWHIPEAHYLESWTDARAYDGTVTIIQPLIAPLYGGKTPHEVLAAFTDRPDRSSHDVVREHWNNTFQGAAADFAHFWRDALHRGVVPGTALPPKAVQLVSGFESRVSRSNPPPKTRNLELVFRPDPTVFDGRFANNGWLQELPKAITKLTWDNAALVSPATAERLGLANEDVVELTYAGRSLRAPVWISPGHARDSVTVHLGSGRTRAGRVGTGAGFNAYALRSAATPWFGTGLELRKTGARYPLASTQHHHSMEGRELVQAGTLEEFRAHPEFARNPEHETPRDLTLYADHPYPGYAWGMAIDLSACIGCNACVVACQAENNIAVVGKDQVGRGREMHWLRIDRYYEGDLDNPATHHQPVPCMHCENAPCELVCPVNATVHSSEGLNEMVYNRCVGTKYCSNNCPYKVRRFNFYLYSNWTVETLKMVNNPDVSVRSRGVMEKCTYCVQRLDGARIQAKKEGRTIRDGEIVTACQQACPAEAIVFGDINDPKSRVAQLKAEPRNYALLGEVNTRPRTTYLAALRNPNTDI
jgi:MoCo/4Fe-4S cofactor protein with predicted Tat translocation signal